jgi:hypothetical protein
MTDRMYNWSQIGPLLAEWHVSYRQFDYWDKQGYLGERLERHGSGTPRDVPWSMVQRAAVMGVLVHAGLTVELAQMFARRRVTLGDEYAYKYGDRVYIDVTVNMPPEPQLVPEREEGMVDS